ncbi:MAG: NHL repeat-containing protein [Deltaproteobacteria bacterium]|nr:NHL repeat-containing protein [Deltaproteobacteria bacterium]
MRTMSPTRLVQSILRNILSAIKPAVVVMVFVVLTIPASAENKSANVDFVIAGDDYVGRLRDIKAIFLDENKKWLYAADAGNRRLVSFGQELLYLSELSHKDLSIPTGLVKTSEGVFYVLDAGNADIRIVNVKDKIITPWVITGMPSKYKRTFPKAIAIGPDENIFIADSINKCILVISKDGKYKRSYTSNDTDFMGFSDVRVGSDGKVYSVDSLGKTIYVFKDNGKLLLKIKGHKDSPLIMPVSIDIDSDGKIHVLDRVAADIKVFSPKGAYLYTIGDKGYNLGQFVHPTYLLIDSTNRIYVSDSERVQVVK